jgi:phospholipid transport system substrate-binding protein
VATIANAQTPEELVKNVAEKLIHDVRSDKSLEGNKEKISVMVDQEVTPYIDFNGMCSKSLGKSFSLINETQQQEYTGLCKKIIINTYSYGLAEFKNLTIKVKPAVLASNGEEVVRSIISQDGDDDIAVDYYMQKAPQGWIVNDVHIEGVSVISNFFNQFNKIVSQDGIGALIERLKNKLLHK